MLESPLDVSRIPYFPPFPRLHLGKTLRNYIIPYTLYTLFISLGWLWGFERCKFLRLVRLVTNLVLETKPPRFGGVFFFQMIFWRSLSFHVIKVEFGSRRWDLDGFSVEFRLWGDYATAAHQSYLKVFLCVLRQNTWYPVGFIYVVTVKISLPALICKEDNLKGRNGGIGFVVMSEKMLHENQESSKSSRVGFWERPWKGRKRPSWFSWGPVAFLGSATLTSPKLAAPRRAGRQKETYLPTPVFQVLW